MIVVWLLTVTSKQKGILSELPIIRLTFSTPVLTVGHAFHTTDYGLKTSTCHSPFVEHISNDPNPHLTFSTNSKELNHCIT